MTSIKRLGTDMMLCITCVPAKQVKPVAFCTRKRPRDFPIEIAIRNFICRLNKWWTFQRIFDQF